MFFVPDNVNINIQSGVYNTAVHFNILFLFNAFSRCSSIIWRKHMKGQGIKFREYYPQKAKK